MSTQDPALSQGARARAERLAGWWRADPDNTLLLEEALEAAIAAGDVDSAAGLLRQARTQGLPPSAADLLQGRLALAQGQAQQAEQLLRQARAQGADAALTDHDRACAAWQLGDLEGCRALLRPWIADDAAPTPHRDALQTLWLRIGHAAGDLSAAMDWARRQATGLGPRAAGVASLLALDADDSASARIWLAHAWQADPPADEALVTAGILAIADGDLVRARAMLDQAQARRPGDGRVLGVQGLLALARREPAAAVPLLEQAVHGIPAHAGSWLALGWARLLTGDLGGARTAFTQAAACDRTFAEGHGALGLCAALAGDPSAARRHLRTAHGLDPGNATGAFAQAVLHGQAGAQHLPALLARVLARPGLDGRMMADQVLQRAELPSGR